MTQTKKHERYGKCLIERVIGRGARATVYLAWHEGLQIPVAVKVMRRVTGPQEVQCTERFVREARIAAQLSHPNIVRVYDCGERGDSYYLVLEYIEGENCRDKLDQWGEFDWRRAVEIVQQVADGLRYANRKGIIHRDLKPENIMIDSDGSVRIADLGLAKEVVTHGSSATLDGDVLGTPYYMSPEQIRQPSEVDFRADIYSLGATLYHMVVGEAPYDAATPFEIMAQHLNEPLPSPDARQPELPPGLCDLMLRCMQKDPEDRYQSYDEMLNDLEALLADDTQQESSGSATAVMSDDAPQATPLVHRAPRARGVKAVELPVTGHHIHAKIAGVGALLAWAAVMVFIFQLVASVTSPLLASSCVLALAAASGAAGFLAFSAGTRQGSNEGEVLARYRTHVRQICARLGIPEPRVHPCRRRDDAAFAYTFFSKGGVLHLPIPWLSRARLTTEEAEAYTAQGLAAIYDGNADIRTALAAPLGLLQLGRSIGTLVHTATGSATDRSRRHILSGLVLFWLVVAAAAVALPFFVNVWAGTLSAGVFAALLLTAAFERSARMAGDIFAAKVINSEEFVQSLLAMRGLSSLDAGPMLARVAGLDTVNDATSAAALGTRRDLVPDIIAFYRETEYNCGTLALARGLFAIAPAAPQRLNNLAGLPPGRSTLHSATLLSKRVVSSMMGAGDRQHMTMRELGLVRLPVLAGAGAGVLNLAIVGLLQLRGSADYATFLVTVAVLGVALGIVVCTEFCRCEVSPARLGWSIIAACTSQAACATVAFCLVGSVPLARFSLQLPVSYTATLIVAAATAVAFVRLGPSFGLDAWGEPAGAFRAEAQGAQLDSGADPAEDMLSSEFTEPEPASVE